MTAPAKTLYLIDGHGFIFRAFHALPPLTRPDGTPVGAVLGFCNILLRVLEEAGDAHIGVIFDPSGGNFRHQIYDQYKANRSEPPEDLKPQFNLVKEATDAFGLVRLEQKGFEADDLIATYTRLAVERGYEVRIISADKDLMQLVRDGVRLVDPIKFTTVGPEQVMEKFGVTPDKVVDVQALAGDSSDNVPGVPSIGIKTAAELINTYGSVENLLANVEQIKQPKRREVLTTHADMARISKKLVALDDNAPLPKDFDELCPHTPDLSQLAPFLKTQGFRSVIARVEKKWGFNAEAFAAPAPVATHTNDDNGNTKAPQAIVERHYALVTTEAELDQWIKRAYAAGIIAIDTETNDLTPARANLVGISMAVAPGHACYIPVGHSQEHSLFAEPDNKDFVQLDKKLVMQKLKPLLEDAAILKVGQNIKYDWQMFAKEGVHITPLDDTMVMSYVLDGSQHGHGMDELAQLHLNETLISYNDVAGTGKNKKTLDQLTPSDVRDYASEDADITLRLYHFLQPRLVTEKRMALYHEVDKPIVSLLAEMELTGITVDKNVLQKLDAEFLVKIEQAEKNIFEHAGVEFNLASPKQLGDVLFNTLGLPGGKKTKTGAYSTDAKTLEELAAQGHDIVDDIIQHRQLAKLRSTYTQTLQDQIVQRTGRVHTSFNLTVTNTGRLSSTDPNLQNIPIRTEEGRMIRTAFVAAPGHKLLSVDYSQIELRLVAEMAGIKRLQDAFKNDQDIHALTASEVFGIPLAEITSETRRAAKAINFGIIYGISGFGLAKQLGTDVGTASAYIKQYMQRFPELAAYMDKTKAYAKQHGCVTTLLGRTIHMPGITSKNGAERAFAERQAINAPIQGTAADIMKLAMTNVARVIRDQNLPAKILLQVHDELVIEARADAAEQIGEIVKLAMQNAYVMNTPLIAECGIGNNWDQAH